MNDGGPFAFPYHVREDVVDSWRYTVVRPVNVGYPGTITPHDVGCVNGVLHIGSEGSERQRKSVYAKIGNDKEPLAG